MKTKNQIGQILLIKNYGNTKQIRKMIWCRMRHYVSNKTTMIKMKCRHKICIDCCRNIHMQCYNVWTVCQLKKYKCMQCEEERNARQRRR